MVVQMAIGYSLGKPTVHIVPSRELKVLYVQAEDYDDDLTEMAQIVNHLKLTPEERNKVNQNTRFEIVNDVVGKKFLRVLEGFIEEWKPDLVIINPYQSYLGKSMTDDEANTLFLRTILNPILDRYNCGIIIVQHTPKFKWEEVENKLDIDLSYISAGVAGLTNWARAILVIYPTIDPDIFTLAAVKRGKKIGWGKGVTRKTICHSFDDNKSIWVDPSLGQAFKATPPERFDSESLLSYVELSKPLTKQEIYERVNRNRRGKQHIGIHRIKEMLDALIRQKRVFQWEIFRGGVRPSICYAKEPQKRANNYR